MFYKIAKNTELIALWVTAPRGKYRVRFLWASGANIFNWLIHHIAVVSGLASFLVHTSPAAKGIFLQPSEALHHLEDRSTFLIVAPGAGWPLHFLLLLLWCSHCTPPWGSTWLALRCEYLPFLALPCAACTLLFWHHLFWGRFLHHQPGAHPHLPPSLSTSHPALLL